MIITYSQELLLLLVGIIAGFLNVMAGGGSLLTIPVMIFMGIPGVVANGTNRIAILAQNIVAVTTFFRRGLSEFKLSLKLGLCTVPGALVGSWYGTQLDGVWFNRVLAAIMLFVMVYMWLGKKRVTPAIEKTYKPNRLLGYGLMVVAGAYGGFIQVGTGFILMPILHRVFGMDLVRVNMHKVFIVLVYTIVALTMFAVNVEIFWTVGLCLAAGNAIGGWLGAHCAVSKGEGVIRIVLNAILLVFVIKLLFF